jgi:2-oxoisovalerate dehydrogenase E1 component
MHLFSPEVGLMGTSGIVGPCILQATGAGYTSRLLNNGTVGVAFFGDGAANNGAFHEGLNLAAIWDLPVIFVCENNMYATEVAFSYATRNTEVAERATTYGMKAVAVDGNDVVAVYQAAGDAVSRARAGQGPTLIEGKTYRTRAHAEGMRDAGYRTVEEVEAWKQRDPISNFQAKLLAQGVAVESDFDAIEADVKAMIEDALEFAKNSPYPDPATVTHYIYSQ